MPAIQDRQRIERLERRVKALPKGLQSHIYRVVDVAEDLAAVHDIDPAKARIGMLAHDLARSMSNNELLALAQSFNLRIDPIEKQLPILLHGPVGAELLHREEGIEDTELYEAVCWHTTGNTSMDSFAKLVFLADKLDPQKSNRYPYQQTLLELAQSDLDCAMLEFLTRELISLTKQGLMVHPDMLATRNFLIQSKT